jgi:hypothetical protein
LQNSGVSLVRAVGGSSHYSAILSVASATNIATEAGFFGLQNGAVFATGFNPSTKTNCFGIGYDSSSANLKMYCAGTAVATPVDLGANFPRGFNEAHAYKITLYLPSAEEATATGNVAMWHVAKVGSGVITATGTTMPASNLFLSPMAVVTPLGTAAAVALSITNITFANEIT